MHNRASIDPPLLAIELRDVTGALLSGEQDLGELGWEPDSEDAEVRFDIRRLPLVEGGSSSASRSRIGPTTAVTTGSRRRPSFGRSAGEAHGFVLFEGDWSLDHASPAVRAPSGAADA